MERTIRFVIISGWALLVVICMIIIGEVCYLSLQATPVPDPLQKLAFTAAGFLFGSFPTLVKDLINGGK